MGLLYDYLFEVMHRDREREVAAQLWEWQLDDEEAGDCGQGRSPWRPLRDEFRRRGGLMRVRLSELTFGGRRERPWRTIRGAGGVNGQGST
jgi:hypothetical protein